MFLDYLLYGLIALLILVAVAAITVIVGFALWMKRGSH